MRTVSRFEATLLQILRSLVGRGAGSQMLPAIVRVVERPRCLSRNCVELIQDTLARGIVLHMARDEGWRRERFLRADRIADGRVWERSQPEELGLEFSINSVDFLIWLAAESPLTSQWTPHKLATLTLGDEYLLFLAYQQMRHTDVAGRWCEQPLFQAHGLCALAFPDDFAEQGVVPAPQFEPWLTGPGAAILETLQRRLALHWLEMEQAKARIVSPDRMRQLGRVQAHVLESFLAAARKADRRDLGRFLLSAGKGLLEKGPSGETWTASLDTAGLRMAERLETYRAAFAFLQQIRGLEVWQAEARSVGYFDEGYAAAQLWKADWERFAGDELLEKTAALTRTTEPLASPAASSET